MVAGRGKIDVFLSSDGGDISSKVFSLFNGLFKLCKVLAPILSLNLMSLKKKCLPSPVTVSVCTIYCRLETMGA